MQAGLRCYPWRNMTCVGCDFTVDIYPGTGCWFCQFSFHFSLSNLAHRKHPTTCYITKNPWSQTRPSSLAGSPHQMEEELMI